MQELSGLLIGILLFILIAVFIFAGAWLLTRFDKAVSKIGSEKKDTNPVFLGLFSLTVTILSGILLFLCSLIKDDFELIRPIIGILGFIFILSSIATIMSFFVTFIAGIFMFIGIFLSKSILQIKILSSLKTQRLKHKLSLFIEGKPYYKKLNYKEQKCFQRRMMEFIVSKKFHAYHNQFELTDEMYILLSATAVKLTFGYKYNYTYGTFRHIVISQDDYVSRSTGKVHKGETNPRKDMIAISWKSFIEGISNPTNGVNVGLHEFSHALFIGNVHGNKNIPFKQSIRSWHKIVNQIGQNPKATNFFRPYAFTNKMEFFAVSIESFFERGKEFQAQLPELYKVMTLLLNQDPLQANNGIVRKKFWEKYP